MGNSKSGSNDPAPGASGVFRVAGALASIAADLQGNAQAKAEARLLLRGESVVDWHRLHMRDPKDVRRLIALNALDLDDPGDQRVINHLRAQAVSYIRDVLDLRLPERERRSSASPSCFCWRRVTPLALETRAPDQGDGSVSPRGTRA